MRKVREFENKKKASFFYNYVAKVSTECAMYFDATTGKYVVTWKWDKKRFSEIRKRGKEKCLIKSKEL